MPYIAAMACCSAYSALQQRLLCSDDGVTRSSCGSDGVAQFCSSDSLSGLAAIYGRAEISFLSASLKARTAAFARCTAALLVHLAATLRQLKNRASVL